MARQQIAQLETMLSSVQEIAEKRFGKIRVSSLPTVVSRILPDALQRYAEKYPKIGVQISDGNHDFVVGQVRAGRAEFGVSMDPGDDEDVDFQPLLTDVYVLATAANGPLGNVKEVTLEDLRTARLIIGGRDSGNRLLLEVLLGHEAVSLRWFYEVEHISSVMSLVQAGLGSAIVPSLSLSAHQATNVRGIPIINHDIHRTIGIVRHKAIPMTPMGSHFCSILLETFDRFASD